MTSRITGYGVGSAKIEIAPVPTKQNGIPSNPKPFDFGQLIQNSATGNWYIYSGGSVFDLLTSSSGSIIQVLGTASQITASTVAGVTTLSIPSAFIAPGSIAATTTLTATLGNITATNGNLAAGTAGTGLLLNPATTSGTTTATLNGRVGQVTITTPSIAGGAVFTMTIANTSVTGSSTQIGYWLSCGTTGAALSIQSVTNSANQSVVVINNGTGATTNTASLVLNFLVLN